MSSHAPTPAAHGHHAKPSFLQRWWFALAVSAFILGMTIAAPKDCPPAEAAGGIITWFFIWRLYLWWSDKKAASSH